MSLLAIVVLLVLFWLEVITEMAVALISKEVNQDMEA